MIHLLAQFAAADPCQKTILGFPTWHKYLAHNPAPGCTIKLAGLNDVWLVVAAVVEILLRVAALAAVGYIIWGGYEYLTSQAEPDKTSRAKSTIINALVGLVIATLAVAIVNFVATQVSK